MGSRRQVEESGRVDPEEVRARLHLNWADYYQLPLIERELVDDKRVIPDPELRRLLRLWHRGAI